MYLTFKFNTHPYYRSYIFLDYQSVKSTLKYETFLKSNIMIRLILVTAYWHEYWMFKNRIKKYLGFFFFADWHEKDATRKTLKKTNWVCLQNSHRATAGKNVFPANFEIDDWFQEWSCHLSISLYPLKSEDERSLGHTITDLSFNWCTGVNLLLLAVKVNTQPLFTDHWCSLGHYYTVKS